jgi:acyl-CoA synthetase (NDP forming)
LAVDLTEEEDPSEGYQATAAALVALTDKPVAVLANLASAVDPSQARTIRRAGVPVLHGTETGLRSVAHLFERRDRGRRAAPTLALAAPIAEWRTRLAAGEVLGESDALALLAAIGVTVIPTLTVSGIDEAVAAAVTSGFPVAMKTTAVHHKSDVGGVRLHLGDSSEVRDAANELLGLGDRLVVQPMGPDGVEVAVGGVVDPQFGPVVIVASGGTLVEVRGDRVLATAPVDVTEARRMIERLSLAPILSGHRGSVPLDIGGLAEVVSLVSVLVAELSEVISSLDVNPVIVHPHGAIAVDGLVFPALT